MSVTEVDQARLEAFMGQAVTDMGAIISAPLMVIGEKLGLYKAMAGRRPAELARRWPSAPGVAERSVREWLRNQAAGGYVTYDPESDRYTLPRRAGAGARRRGQPVLHPRRLRADRLAVRRRGQDPRGLPQRRRAWAGTSTTTACSAAPSASSAPATRRNLVAEWIPALDGVQEKLEARREGRRRRLRPRRLDDHHGRSVPELASSSASTTTRPRSSARARRPRKPASPTASRFEVAAAKDYPGQRLRPRRACSTACTTWATRSAPRPTCARRSPTTAPG